MSKKSVHTYHLDNVSPDKALKVISDPEFEVAQQLSQEGTKSAVVKVISSDENALVFEMRCEEYAKGLTGLDRNKIEHSLTVVKWDLKKRRSSWAYEGSHGNRVRISGMIQISPEGNGCRCNHEVVVEIKVPLIGRKIESMVIKGTEKHMTENYEPLVRKACL